MRTNDESRRSLVAPRAQFHLADFHVHSPGSAELRVRGRFDRLSAIEKELANGIETPYARYDGYRYDPVGNRIEEWREDGVDGAVMHVEVDFDAANRLVERRIDSLDDGLAIDEETYAWMAQGALLTRTLTPAAGSVEVSSWTYDAADRLVSYTVPGEGSVSAEYDTRGRRVGVSQTDTATATTTERRVLFDGLQEVSEYDGDSAADPTVPTRTQTTTRRLDEVIGSSLPPAVSGEDRPWRTHHGDIIQSGTLAADQDGGVDSRGRYRAYGEPLEGGGDPAWGFAGRPHEVGGMVPLRARSYGPGLGAFVSADPLDGYEGMPQTQADYGYASATPTRFVDPSGLAVQVALILAGAVLLGLSALLMVHANGVMLDALTRRDIPRQQEVDDCFEGVRKFRVALALGFAAFMLLALAVAPATVLLSELALASFISVGIEMVAESVFVLGGGGSVLLQGIALTAHCVRIWHDWLGDEPAF